MRNPNPVILEGLTLRDSLVISGKNPELLRKLNDLVDRPYLAPAEFEKLKNLIAKAAL